MTLRLRVVIPVNKLAAAPASEIHGIQLSVPDFASMPNGKRVEK
jgi:hypothetical protein